MAGCPSGTPRPSLFRWFLAAARGDWVEVRPAAEILATLDPAGDLEAPFMPEMLRFAGRRFRVESVAHKTCDT